MQFCSNYSGLRLLDVTVTVANYLNHLSHKQKYTQFTPTENHLYRLILFCALNLNCAFELSGTKICQDHSENKTLKSKYFGK